MKLALREDADEDYEAHVRCLLNSLILNHAESGKLACYSLSNGVNCPEMKNIFNSLVQQAISTHEETTRWSSDTWKIDGTDIELGGGGDVVLSGGGVGVSAMGGTYVGDNPQNYKLYWCTII